jgi:hypothetical protein
MSGSMILKISAVCCGMMCAALIGCSPVNTAQSQGPGTEVIGQVVIPGDSSVINGLVFLRQTDFLADTSQNEPVSPQAKTDENGRFTIRGVLPGSYAIEIMDTSRSDARRAVLIKYDVVQDQSQAQLPEGTLKPVSTVSGSILGRGEGVWVQIYGLQSLAKVDPLTGAFTIKDVPEGVYSLHVVGVAPLSDSFDIRDVTMVPGDTTRLPFAGWLFSRRYSLNTTVSGANITGNVTGFPVLIRLTSSNFDFSAAKAGGDDIRFSKADGSLLGYQIERWDAAGGRAEVWVQADTIYGNDSAQTIAMYWGNPGASAASNGAKVFDTAAGFKAVWHFSQSCDDATYNKMNGINYGASDTEGVAGYSKLFNGADSIKVPGPINGTQNLMLSAWVKFDTTDTLGGEVISLGDDALIRVDDPNPATGTHGSYRFDSTFASYYRTSSGTMLKKTGWRYVAYTIDGAGGVQSLYIDGMLSSSTQNKKAIFYNPGRSISIGTHGYDWQQASSDYLKCHFFGAIDEVRICRTVRSPDWIKLCYMNQKPVDVLVGLK